MFPVGLYLLALVGGAVISAASLPLWRRWCEHVGLLDAPGHRKIHKHPVPLAGGLAVVTGLAAPILAAAAWAWLGPLPESFDRVVTYGLAKRGWQLAAILSGAVAMLALGIIDDRCNLSAKWKFAGQVLIALGDSDVDSEMLAAAHHAVVVLNHKRSADLLENLTAHASLSHIAPQGEPLRAVRQLDYPSAALLAEALPEPACP